jgi:hypothetical protein
MLYELIVEDLAGSEWLATLLIGMLFVVISMFGSMSFFLTATMLAFFLTVFGILFGGIIIWLPLFLGSLIYFFLQLYKFLQE